MTRAAPALRAATAEVLPDEAAVTLLAGTGCFTRRTDFTSRFTASDHGTGIMLAWTDWDAGIIALDSGELPAFSYHAEDVE